MKTTVGRTVSEESMSHPNPCLEKLAMFPDPPLPPSHDWCGLTADPLSTYPACMAPGRDCVVSSRRSRGIRAGSGSQVRRCGLQHGWVRRKWTCCTANRLTARGSRPEEVGRHPEAGERHGRELAYRPCLNKSTSVLHLDTERRKPLMTGTLIISRHAT
jgi:hypothetical protein